MLVKRSMKAKKKAPIEQLLDVLGPCLADAEDFCLTDLNITIGQDPQDVCKAVLKILRRVEHLRGAKKRKK